QRLVPRWTVAVLRPRRHRARLACAPNATRSARRVAPGRKTVGSLPMTCPPLTRLREPFRTLAERPPATLTSKTATSRLPLTSVHEAFGATYDLDAAGAAWASTAAARAPSRQQKTIWTGVERDIPPSVVPDTGALEEPMARLAGMRMRGPLGRSS